MKKTTFFQLLAIFILFILCIIFFKQYNNLNNFNHLDLTLKEATFKGDNKLISLVNYELKIKKENEQSSEEDLSIKDIYELGEYLYRISYLDTERSLKLITYEGYGESPLSYYVACCCWTRATEGYWGYSNLYTAFGEADTSYDEWMDWLGIADYAYDALYECYMNPSYIRYCNGMAIPAEYIYYENGIYVWN